MRYRVLRQHPKCSHDSNTRSTQVNMDEEFPENPQKKQKKRDKKKEYKKRKKERQKDS